MERLFAIILLTIISVLEIILMLNRTILPYELVVILLFLLIILSMIFMLNQRYFWGMTLLGSILNMVNIAYLALLFGIGYILHMSTALAIIVFILSLVFLAKKRKVLKIKRKEPKPRTVEIEKEISIPEERPRVIIEEYKPEPVVDKPKVVTVKRKPRKKSVKRKKPAKKKVVNKVVKKTPNFVASSKAKTYHTFKCDWVDNIKRKNKIYLASRKKAEDLGLKPHTCVDPSMAKKYLKKAAKKKAVKKSVAKRKPAKRKVTKRTYKRKPKKKVVKQVKKTYKPGKYLSSTQGKVYHIPKCKWANNIDRKNRVWFSSKQKAEKLGYTKHSCVK